MSQIKLAVLIVLYSINLFSQKDDVLFYIEDTPVTVSEFMYIYEKNNRNSADYSKESIDEYLNLYINFKLKVFKAISLGYDQSKAYQDELAGYRRQLADSYVIDKEVITRMVDEIFVRHQSDVELEHILISLAPKSTREQKQTAFDKITVVQREIENGMPWERAVLQFSQDRASAPSSGNIGFINAPLPDGYIALENEAYDLKIGEISKPVKTSQGYHILRVVSKRPARGVMEGAHLLIRKESNGIRLADAEPRINKISQSIRNGTTTFDEATIIYSEDKDTKGNVGNLGFFGIGQYERSFEDRAFELTKDGEVSLPVETSVGWHIIKRISKRSSDDKKIIAERIKSNPKQGERFDLIRKQVVETIKKEASFEENDKLLAEFAGDLKEDFFQYNWKVESYTDKELASFGNVSYNLNDFADYAKKRGKERMRSKGQMSIFETVDYIYNSFVADKAISYAESRLEERYPDFKNLMREYKEGILLFDITKDFVWDKAAGDTSAINLYYNNHRKDYTWEDRALVTHYNISSVTPVEITSILNASRKRNPIEMTELFNKDRELLHYRQETLEKSNKTLEGMTFGEGIVTLPEFNQGLKTTLFKKIEQIIPARPKTLKEAKGYVISDYQDQLDREWIKSLKKEFSVKIQKKVLKKLVH